MNVLTRIFNNPQLLADLAPQDWDKLLRFARFSRLLGTLHGLVKSLELEQRVPTSGLEMLEAERVRSNFMQLQAHRVMTQIEKALKFTNYPVILLKGSAYLANDLPPALGRRLSDVDLLVAVERLDETEQLLSKAGWQTSRNLTRYDEHYYRDWMHEIPPLRHPTHAMEIDLHHNLTPHTSRIMGNSAPDLLTLMWYWQI